MATNVLAAQAIGFGKDVQEAAERTLSLFAAQQRTKRGPTPEVFFVKRFDNTRIVKADDKQPEREQLVALLDSGELRTLDLAAAGSIRRRRLPPSGSPNCWVE